MRAQVLKANQDLLDRAGVSKINKSMTISKKITETKDIKLLEDEIKSLKAELGIK